jgi:hypothetical protein
LETRARVVRFEHGRVGRDEVQGHSHVRESSPKQRFASQTEKSLRPLLTPFASMTQDMPPSCAGYRQERRQVSGERLDRAIVESSLLIK